MKEGYKIKKLTDVCSIQYGYAFDSKCFCDDSNYPQLIRIRDVVRGFSETYYNGIIPEGYYVSKGELLIGMDGEFNISPWKSDDALLNQRVCKVSSNGLYTIDGYICYCLKVLLKKIEDETPFVTVKHLSAKRLNDVKISLPPLSIQQQIVHELDLLSGIIEKQKKQLKELDNLAQSIFYQMFGNPVENEKGWECGRLEKYADFKNGLNFSKTESGINYKFLGVPDFKDNNTIKSSMLDDIYLAQEISEDYYLKDGDIVFVRSNGSRELVGRNVLVHVDTPTTYSGFCIRCRIKSEKILPEFLSSLLKTPQMRPLISNSGQGCNISNLNQKILGLLPIIEVPISLQQEFVSKKETIEHQKSLIKTSIKESEDLFNSRMDYYFN